MTPPTVQNDVCVFHIIVILYMSCRATRGEDVFVLGRSRASCILPQVLLQLQRPPDLTSCTLSIMSASRRVSAKLASSLSSSSTTQTRAQRICRLTRRHLSISPRLHQERSTSTAGKATTSLSPSDESQPLHSLTDGLQDPPPILNENEKQVDWTRSYHGLSSTPFTPEQAAILQEPLELDDIEIKPDGIVYLPEIKYRRKLNRAFGPGGWGLAPRGETIVTGKLVTREYGLVCGGR